MQVTRISIDFRELIYQNEKSFGSFLSLKPGAFFFVGSNPDLAHNGVATPHGDHILRGRLASHPRDLDLNLAGAPSRLQAAAELVPAVHAGVR